MARTETKNIVVAHAVGTGIGETSTQMNVGEDIQKNFHNIWLSMCVEPQTVGANANGQWVFYLESDAAAAIMTPSVGFLNAETKNYQIIACGCWVASNETPWNFSENVGKTSRNVRQNGRLILVVRNEGITSGLTDTKVMLCAGSTTI